MRYHLVTLGCQMNKSDSERVRTMMDGMGLQWTDDEAGAEVLGVVACSVRQKAIDRVYSRIRLWNQWKRRRSLITFVSGCMLPADREKFLTLFDLTFTMNELPQVPDMIRQYGVMTPMAAGESGPSEAVTAGGQPEGAEPEPAQEGSSFVSLADLRSPGPLRRVVMDGLWRVKASHTSGVEAFVPIQNGCDKFCTFCAVPYTRGREVSRDSREILDEVAELIAGGHRSITLLGQNVNSYGLDRAGQELTFPRLMDRIGEMGDSAGRPLWVYFTSPHPRDFTTELLEVMASRRCLARQVHLPAQSGDDKVLLRMNRQYSSGDYRRLVDVIREHLPDVTLFTDIIVGFSGETEEQFANTLRLMEDVRFNMAYTAIYSPRPGAASSRWVDDVPHAVKSRRLQELNEVLRKHAAEYCRGLVGRRMPVLVTGRDVRGGGLSGHTEGRVTVRVNGADDDRIGHFLDVDILSSVPLSVAGEAATAVVRA